MGPFEMVVALVFIGTVGKVLQAALATRSPRGLGSAQEVQALQAELQGQEARLAQTEQQVADLSEKLVFVEKLLAQPERVAELPSSPRQGAVG